MASQPTTTGLSVENLRPHLSGGTLLTDDVERAYFGQDYFNKGPAPAAVFQPSGIEELARVLKVATSAGFAIYPRGGGYSYTDGYLVTRPGITIDMKAMDRIVEINREDMFVTVEAGCSWAKLDEALSEHGLRTPFWGPMSGRDATVGGGASQGAVSFGSAKYGISTDSIIGMALVTVDGRIIRTGSANKDSHSPFFRNYGPDLTGLFCGDCGVLGVKAEVTLKLIERPKEVEGLSFGFKDYPSYFKAAAAVARQGLVTESIGTLPETVSDQAADAGFLGGLKALRQVIRASNSLLQGLGRAAKIAFAGANFADNHAVLLHVVVEGADTASVGAMADRVRAAVGDTGSEIANTVPMMIRAEPFPSYDMLSLTGQRQLPPSTILPFSKVQAFHDDLTARIDARKGEMERLGVSVAPVFATIGTSGFLYEIVMAWDDKLEEFHRRHTKPEVVAKAQDFAEAPDAKKLAEDLRGDLIEAALQHGGVHVQIGKVYPYTRSRDSEALAIVRALKMQLDPDGLCNPGALGL